MSSPGITTRPIPLISGKSNFCQVFFDNVRVPKEQLVGEPGAGWKIAKRLLQFERTGISASAQSGLGGTPAAGRWRRWRSSTPVSSTAASPAATCARSSPGTRCRARRWP